MLVLLFSNNIDSRFTPAGPNLIFGQKNWELFWRVSLLSGCRKLQKVLKNLLLTKERKNLSPFQNMKILYFFGCCENVEQAIILAKKSFLCISFLRTDLGKDKLVTKIASPNFYTIHLLKKIFTILKQIVFRFCSTSCRSDTKVWVVAERCL